MESCVDVRVDVARRVLCADVVPAGSAGTGGGEVTVDEDVGWLDVDGMSCDNRAAKLRNPERRRCPTVVPPVTSAVAPAVVDAPPSPVCIVVISIPPSFRTTSA